MATIHPSRLGLVPHDVNSDRQRGRSPSPRSSRRLGHSSSRSPGRSDGPDRSYRDARRATERESDRRNHRARADDYFDGERRGDNTTEQSRSMDRKREHEREGRNDKGQGRRMSPEYSDYRRPSPSYGQQDDPAPAPWRQQENMYPNRRGGAPVAFGGNGTDFLDSRRQQREQSNVTLWPPSPKAPTKSSLASDSRHKKSKRRRRDSSVSSDTDSEEERRRRERKERKRLRKEKERKERRSRSRSARQDSDANERDRRHRRARRRTRSRSASADQNHDKRSATRTKSPEQLPPKSEDEDDWVEKPAAPSLLSSKSGTSKAPPYSATIASTNTGQPADDESGDEVGPQPLSVASSSKKVDERQYGGALLRGEGSAMAAFLKDGTDIRIPRRGEIGLTSDEIAQYEQVGYVMSGSRHRRMNAVRMRKENQVISAEEKRGILKLQQEERERREAILREEFQQLVQEKLKSQGAGK